jgi:metal-responsive CopG/Arc/MetJ family transcriptional regulator
MAKIAISVPDTLLDAIENERAASGVSRSEFFRRAVEEHLRREREREDIERYIRGYQLYPETEEEIALAESTLHYAFDEDSWEEEFNQ